MRWYNEGTLNQINGRGDASTSHGPGNCIGGTATMKHSTPNVPNAKNCAVCGSPFRPKSSIHKYCSHDCRQEAIRAKGVEYQARYREKHLDEIRERKRTQQRERRLRDPERYRERHRSDMRAWRESNPQASRSSARAYYRRNAEDRRAYQARYRSEYRERVKAQWAVNDAVKRGALPHAKTLNCTRCGQMATEYHHWSYDRDRWLDVEPMCPTCHARADRERTDTEL